MRGTPAERFAAILELYEFSVRQMRANLRRRFPDEHAAQIESRLAEWLASRSGAENGDAVGRVVTLPTNQ